MKYIYILKSWGQEVEITNFSASLVLRIRLNPEISSTHPPNPTNFVTISHANSTKSNINLFGKVITLATTGLFRNYRNAFGSLLPNVESDALFV